jgi:hypothetical protein
MASSQTWAVSLLFLSDSMLYLLDFLMQSYGGLDLQEAQESFQLGNVRPDWHLSELAHGHLHAVVLVTKQCNVEDVDVLGKLLHSTNIVPSSRSATCSSASPHSRELIWLEKTLMVPLTMDPST